MEEANRLEDWHKTEKTICRINRELFVRVNILTNQPTLKFREQKDSNQFSIFPDYKEFVILSFYDFNNKGSYSSICFGIEQFFEFLDFLEKHTTNWFKYSKIENGIPDYKYFVYHKEKNKFLVKQEYMNTRKRFNNTCGNKPIDIVPSTMEDNSPRVGIIMAFGEDQYTFVKKNDLLGAIKMLKSVDYVNFCAQLFTISLMGINSSINIKRQTNSEFTFEQERSKVKLIETKKDLRKYCINNKIEFTKEEFESNSLEDLKEAVLNYISSS